MNNTNLDNYYNFLEICKNKIYERTHKHHIIPKCMNGDNSKDNIIKLGYEDHQLAHIILAQCFDKNSKEYFMNINSAIKLNGWIESERKNIDLNKMSSDMKKGKSHIELYGEEKANLIKRKRKKTYVELYGEEKANEMKISKSIFFKKYWSNIENIIKQKEKSKIYNAYLSGRTYVELYGEEKANKIKLIKSENFKKMWQKFTEEEIIDIRKKMIENIKITVSNRTEDRKKEIHDIFSNSSKKMWKELKNNDDFMLYFSNKISFIHSGKTISEEQKNKIKNTIHINKSHVGEKNSMYNKHHKEESKKLIASKLKNNKNSLNKTHSTFEFFKDNLLIEIIYGQKNAKIFCKKNNIPYQTLCKKNDTWRNWFCKRNKIK
jgi:hypothetical protein